jgi:hypothetical protein
MPDRAMSGRATRITRIIACAVFKPALENLRLQEKYPDLRITYLPALLHLKPQELQNCLDKAITSAREAGERVICLYGQCFPEIDDFCQQRRVTKVPGQHCYEMLLGEERFQQLIDEVAGTFLVEKDFLLNFEEYCVEPLELRDEEMRRQCFGQYQRLVYIRQPSDPDLMPQAGEMAEFLGLSLNVVDADYSHLKKTLDVLL